MSHFRFGTEWRFDAPIEQVWALLNDPARFPTWWPAFERARVMSGQDGAIGSVTRYRVRGDFGLVFDFTLRVEAKRAPEYLRLRAAGDFAGSGEWRLRTAPGWPWSGHPGAVRRAALRRQAERAAGHIRA